MSAAATPEELASQALLLDNQLCFLVYRLQRSITDLYRPLLGELGLTYPQYLVMLALWERDPLTVSQLGERLDLASGTLSPLLKRLESGGLVSRSRDAGDERSVLITLTAAGRELRAAAQEVPTRIADTLAGTADDYWAARSFLTRMLERVAAGSAE